MVNIPWLADTDINFPPVERALEEPNGLLAAGGDLSPQRLLTAYEQGIFPWYEDGQPILWWSPDPRIVLFPDQIHVARSLRKVLRQQSFRVSADTCFDTVIDQCAQPRRYGGGTWITEEMREAYGQLHLLGYAHSIEVWKNDQLVGGLYGVALGRVFFGESMFSLASNASKVALVYLCGQLQRWGYQLIDCQVESPHLTTLGAVTVARGDFQNLLNEYTKVSAAEPGKSPGKWRFHWRYAEHAI